MEELKRVAADALYNPFSKYGQSGGRSNEGSQFNYNTGGYEKEGKADEKITGI